MCSLCGESKFKNKLLSFLNNNCLPVVFETILMKRNLELGGGRVSYVAQGASVLLDSF